jgi:uncharacterized protein (DUF58 family)
MAQNTSRTRRSIRPAGYVFILIMLLLLLAAWNTGTNLFYLVFGAISSFLLISAAASRFSLRRLELVREAPAAVYRDARFNTLIRLENKRSMMPAISVCAEKILDPKTRADDETPEREAMGYVLSLPSGKTAILRTTDVYAKRGVYPLPPIELVTSFPFGLVECRRRVSDGKEIVVYPRVLPARTALVEQAEGRADILKTTLGEGDEFFSLREYVAGDDLRRVAWKASARSRTLLVRDLERQTSRHVQFTFDSRLHTNVDDFAENFEAAIEMIASLAFTLLARQYSVGLITSDGELPEGEGQAQFIKLLEMLARLEPADPSGRNPFADTPSDGRGISHLFVSSDPAVWGRREERANVFVLNPREVIRA